MPVAGMILPEHGASIDADLPSFTHRTPAPGQIPITNFAREAFFLKRRRAGPEGQKDKSNPSRTVRGRSGVT